MWASIEAPPLRRHRRGSAPAFDGESVVGDWTGIPVGRMVKDEIETILNLEERLAQRVIGQDHGLTQIAKRIETELAGDQQLSLRLHSPGYETRYRSKEFGTKSKRPQLYIKYAK